MKKILIGLVLMPLMVLADTWIDPNTGITWTYVINDGEATVKGSVPSFGALEIPSTLNGYLVTNIGEWAFEYRSGLTSVTISEGVTSIGNYAFCGCSGLTKVTIPSSVTSIGESAFSGCSGLTSVTIPSSVIGEWAFEYCSGLTSVTISEGVTSIGNGAFDGCSGLMEVTIPEGVTSIGWSAFYDCSGLKSVAIPPSVTSIGKKAFSCCSGLMSFSVASGNPSYASINGLLCTKDGKTVIAGINGEVVIPSSVTRIEEWAFSGCSGLMEVTIPEGVTSIGWAAFCDCSGLKSVAIPPSVTSIGAYAFDGCSGLKSIVVETGDVERVKGLLDESGFDVSDVAFVERKTDGGPYTDVVDGVEWTYVISDGKAQVDEIPTSTTGAITIPSTLGGCPVTSIGSRAFCGCSGLTSVTIPSSVTSVGGWAFENCYELKDVYLSGVHPPFMYEGVFAFCNADLVLHAPQGWKGRSRILGGVYLEVGGEHEKVQQVYVMTTNVVVNYVFNSVQPQFVIPASSDVGFVNIIAEVKGGAVAVPSSWAENYPDFVSKFGNDFTKALTMKTGKKDGAGNEMLVWQDYVAGTDPTDENDVFRASITIVEGQVKISWSPELDAERAALRKYTTWGKKSLMDVDWAEVPAGSESKFNFFKVTVEMK